MRTNDPLVVSLEVTRDNRLSMSARYLYAIILTEAAATGYCTRTNGELGTEMDRTDRHISRLISELVRAGYIERKIIYSPEKPGEIIERQLFPRPAATAEAAKVLTKWRREHG